MLPRAVKHFLDHRIRNVEQLEVLLLLQQHAGRSWSAEQVAEALRLSRQTCAETLKALGRRDLLDVRVAEDVRYRFRPANEELAVAVQQLVAAHREVRAAVVAFVAAGRSEDASARDGRRPRGSFRR